MSDTNYKVVLNSVILNKIDSMQNDIKVYVNLNASLASEGVTPLMHHEDVEALLVIRNQLKALHSKISYNKIFSEN